MSKDEKKTSLFMRKLIIVRETVIRQRRISVRLTKEWLATQMLILPFAGRTYVCFTTIVGFKYGSNRHRTLQVATCIKEKLYMASTTGRSNVCLTVHLQSLQYYFLALRSATGARTEKTCSTRDVTKHARPVVTEDFNRLILTLPC